MVGLVIVTHGELARSLLGTAEAIMGPLEATVAVCLERPLSPADARARLVEAVAQVQTGGGILCLVDMLGGTPCNLGLGLSQGAEVEVVAGVNLPMLLSVATRDSTQDARQLAAAAVEAGRAGVLSATERLRARGGP